MSASGMTIMWFLAPPKHCTRFPAAQPRVYTYSAIGVEPIAIRTAEVQRAGLRALSAHVAAADEAPHRTWAHVRDLLTQGGLASDEDLKAIDREIKAIVNEAAEFSKESPEPALSELWTDIYA